VPGRALARVAGGFLALWTLHYLPRRFLELGWNTPLESFPVSVFRVNLAPTGLPWLALFLLVAWWAAGRVERLGPGGLWAAGLLLLLLGNMGEGSFQAGFLDPLLGGDNEQYARDAATIADWRGWLADFNRLQPTLHLHAQFHPPFPVLLIHALLAGFGPTGAALAMTLLSSLTVPLGYALFRQVAAPGPAARLTLLLALLPAFNVYGAVSLEGVITLAMTLFLWGLLRLLRPADWRVRTVAVGAMTLGLLAANLLTFLAVFAVAAGGLAALAALLRRRDYVPLLGGAVATAIAAAALGLLGPLAGYDHLAAFRLAERLHNPDGWWLLDFPSLYLASRLECVLETLLFLSLHGSAFLLFVARPWRRPQEPAATLGLAAAAAYGLMLLAGTMHTGESARSLLFIYPWLLLPLAAFAARIDRAMLGWIALQTALMQFVGDFFW